MKNSVGALRRTTYSSGLEVVEAWDYFPTKEDFRFMGKAIAQAKKAIRQRNVGVGAVLVAPNGKSWGAHSTELSEEDPYAHAEHNVTRAAREDGESLARMLPHSRLYLTMEPCIGDAHFLTQGGIGTILAAASYEDVPKFVSQRSIHGSDIIRNSGRSLTVIHGLLAEGAKDLMVADHKFHQSNPQNLLES